jgi:prephenate dehydrogenase
VAVIGLGLVGGSLARALMAGGHDVIGVDRSSVRRRALAAGAVAHGRAALEAAAAEAEVVVLAAPPRANLALLRRLARLGPPGPVVTDVGSVKGPICAEALRLGLRRFVGGHPVAGNEGSGFSAASAGLFRGRSWVLVPGPDRRALALVRSLVRAAGARPVVLSAAEHDRALAFLSHGPQVASWALFAAARRDPVARRALGLAGPGFRDMTRLARSPRALWREILAENRAEVRRALRALEREIARHRR